MPAAIITRTFSVLPSQEAQSKEVVWLANLTLAPHSPKSNAKSPQDVLATMYRHLGVDTTVTSTDGSGRPHPVLPSGRVIEELS